MNPEKEEQKNSIFPSKKGLSNALKNRFSSQMKNKSPHEQKPLNLKGFSGNTGEIKTPVKKTINPLQKPNLSFNNDSAQNPKNISSFLTKKTTLPTTSLNTSTPNANLKKTTNTASQKPTEKKQSSMGQKENKYQDHRLFNIKNSTPAHNGEKYQDHRLFNIKDNTPPHNGEKYQDHRLHNIKNSTPPHNGEKYQDHRLFNIKNSTPPHNGEKYQDHRLHNIKKTSN